MFLWQQEKLFVPSSFSFPLLSSDKTFVEKLHWRTNIKMSSTMIIEKLRTEQEHPRSDESLSLRAKKSFARRRKGPANDLYKTLMSERIQSRDVVSIEHGKPRNSGGLPVFTFKSGRQSALDIVVDEDTQYREKNPMVHFEHGINYTVRPRCPKVSIPRAKDSNGEEDDESEKDVDELICSEIAEAFEDDLFTRRPVFDNRWSCGGEDQASNKSLPIHREIPQHSMQRDLSASTLPGSHTNDSVDNAGFRFQLKQETGKLKSEILASANDSNTLVGSYPPGVESTNKYNGSGNNSGKYWTTNKDMQSKWISEKIGRGLQTVRRFALDPYGSKSKPLSSRVKRVCSEDGFQSKRLEILIQDKFSKAPPLVKRVNSTASIPSHTGLSDYLDSVRKSRNGYHEVALKSLEDKTVRDALLAGKKKSDKLWSQSEKLEFLV
ncbi:hypothetical protein ZYGR_0U02110 [Zygosaccharomyces rouxii]|uniref:Uncharacterized protein n=1 Tax=Zygosaccharomyces rouxii TaxID=4956 RepID=A0A1Q3A3Q1_ZYGRO|nr:hypothetical protein ZYGR_0U02110 [Zygosaccharomyces rouxii]